MNRTNQLGIGVAVGVDPGIVEDLAKNLSVGADILVVHLWRLHHSDEPDGVLVNLKRQGRMDDSASGLENITDTAVK